MGSTAIQISIKERFLALNRQQQLVYLTVRNRTGEQRLDRLANACRLSLRGLLVTLGELEDEGLVESTIEGILVKVEIVKD